MNHADALHAQQARFCVPHTAHHHALHNKVAVFKVRWIQQCSSDRFSYLPGCHTRFSEHKTPSNHSMVSGVE